MGSTYGTIEGYRAVKGSGARLLANSVMNSAGGRGAKLANALGCLGEPPSSTAAGSQRAGRAARRPGTCADGALACRVALFDHWVVDNLCSR